MSGLPLAVVVALDAERDALRRASAGAAALVEIHCGMGQERARAATRAALSGDGAPRVSGVIVAGFAGATDPTLRAGDVIVPNAVVSLLGNDPRELSCELGLLGELAGLAALGRLVATVGAPVARVAEKAEIWRSHGAAAVDMESAAVLDIAAELSLPAACLRVIVDDASTPLVENIDRIVDHYGRAKPFALVRELARRPTSLAGLLRLAPAARKAKRALADALGRVFGG